MRFVISSIFTLSHMLVGDDWGQADLFTQRVKYISCDGIPN